MPYVINLPMRTHNFVGREIELKAIKEAFESPSCGALVIGGLEGMGKTGLVTTYAYCDDDVTHAIWLKRESVDKDYLAFANRLELPMGSNVHAKIKEWFATNSDWILVFDNFHSLTEVAPYLPEAKANGLVLITSRSNKWGDLQRLDIGPLSENEAVKLLKTIFRARHENDDALLALANKVACIPQELIKCAHEMPPIPIADYLRTIPQIDLTKIKKGFGNYIDFLSPPMPANPDFAFKNAPQPLLFGLHRYLDDSDLALFSHTNLFFEKLFRAEMKNRAVQFFKPNSIDRFLLKSHRDRHKNDIKKKFEAWCKANQTHFDLLTFEGNAYVLNPMPDRNTPLQDLSPPSEDDLPIKSRQMIEEVIVKIDHDFLPPALRKIVGQLNVISAFQLYFPAKVYPNPDLTIDFNNHRQQTLDLLVDPIGESKDDSSVSAMTSGFFLEYELSFRGRICHKGKSIELSELFPDFVKEGRVVMKLVTPIAYHRFSLSPRTALKDDRDNLYSCSLM